MKEKRGNVQKILKTLDVEYKKAKRLRIGFIGTWFYQHDVRNDVIALSETKNLFLRLASPFIDSCPCG